MKHSCVHCKFFGDDIVGGYRAGVCRRYAPRVVVTEINSYGNSMLQNFPVVYTDDWCGEYIEDLNNGYSLTQEEAVE